MKKIEISIAIVKNEKSEYLLSLRALKSHQGGKWEFPGGKVEQGETTAEAMCRELKEEVGLQALKYILFDYVCFDYSDRQLHLYFYLVEKYKGEASSCEGQVLRWVSLSALNEYDFPKGNKTIVKKLCQNG
ncbi:8-oxo-dGTP diphosphatase MutT [Psychromonas sp. CD1]|uniref:8-oxo-dGTP diphosphatase MutT n=1 Tax=Psychromonas sp. CD1 TaxID=1979839 RepID=UPI000B9C3408|nr:8-oxo-dGTP diphosphatase MutT [Psychromonas sp. CD1]